LVSIIGRLSCREVGPIDPQISTIGIVHKLPSETQRRCGLDRLHEFVVGHFEGNVKGTRGRDHPTVKEIEGPRGSLVVYKNNASSH
jgi:hypothetical protein